MKLTRATPADAADLAAIHLAARRAAMPWLPHRHDLGAVEAFLAHVVVARETVWIASDAGQPLGYAAVHAGWLTHLYVAPEHWRRGVGSTLLRRVLETSGTLQLHVFQPNLAARRFYRAHGFHEAEARAGSHNEEGIPDLCMIRHRPG